MEGSHSPFGVVWQVASATGWSLHYIMWKIPYVTLLLMMQDSPRWVDDSELMPEPHKKAHGKSNTAALFEQKLNK
ncbi:MAG: hypothetical protein WCS17_12795 [Prevotella sp.]